MKNIGFIFKNKIKIISVFEEQIFLIVQKNDELINIF